MRYLLAAAIEAERRAAAAEALRRKIWDARLTWSDAKDLLDVTCANCSHCASTRANAEEKWRALIGIQAELATAGEKE